MKGLELIVIDMDDTVYLERDYVYSGFAAVDRYVQERRTAPKFFDMIWTLFNAGVREDTFDRAIAALDLADVVDVRELVDCYRSHMPDIAMTNDAVDFLTTVHDFVPIALITGGPPESQYNKIEALGLDKYLDETIVTGEREARWQKPGAPAFELVQSHYAVDPSRCLYFADNPAVDFDVPLALGWQAYRIRRPGGLHSWIDSSIPESATLPGPEWINARFPARTSQEGLA